MRLVTITLLAFVATCLAQTNSWFYIENYDSTGCTGNLLVQGYLADGTCHPNPPGSFKATCTGGTPTFQTCTDTACQTCTDGTPSTVCSPINGIFQKATCSDGTYPNGDGYILKKDYLGTSTCTDNAFRLTYLPLGCTTTASFGAASAKYECNNGVANGEQCTDTTCGSCTSLGFSATCTTNTDSDIKSTHTCTGGSGNTNSTVPTSTTAPTTTTPTTTTPTKAPTTTTPTKAPTTTTTPSTQTPTKNNNNTPNNANTKAVAVGFVLGAIVLAL